MFFAYYFWVHPLNAWTCAPKGPKGHKPIAQGKRSDTLGYALVGLYLSASRR